MTLRAHGGKHVSASCGYWLSHCSEAPRSSIPWSISKISPCTLVPDEYRTATLRSPVADMKPNSTPPIVSEP